MNFLTESLYVAGMIGAEDLGENVLVSEVPCFLSHHPVFCRGIGYPLDNEGRRMPLAERSVPKELVGRSYPLVVIAEQFAVVSDNHVKTFLAMRSAALDV